MHANTSSAPATSCRAKNLSLRMHLAHGKFDINIGKGEGSRKDKKQERSTTSESSSCGKVSSWWMALAFFQRGNSHILLKAVLWLCRMEFWNTAQQRAPLITETHLRAHPSYFQTEASADGSGKVGVRGNSLCHDEVIPCLLSLDSRAHANSIIHRLLVLKGAVGNYFITFS